MKSCYSLLKCVEDSLVDATLLFPQEGSVLEPVWSDDSHPEVDNLGT